MPLMLLFSVYTNGQPAETVNLAGAYTVGADDVPLRAEITFRDGIITCKKRSTGPAGLVLLWPLRDVGTIMLETVRLPERQEPYLLQVELARARLVRLIQKLEDWGLLKPDGGTVPMTEVNRVRELLVEALQAADDLQAADLGHRALREAVRASESITVQHADSLWTRRKQSGSISRRALGCAVPLDGSLENYRAKIAGAFDFVTVPFLWRDIEPMEQTFNWKPIDACIEALAKMRLPLKGSALVSLNENHVPDWVRSLEHDFDAFRDLAFEHARRLVNRYGQYIQMWDVVSGIHASSAFNFSFEQIIELTRMAAALTKQIAPRSMAIVDLVAPWGEYYARNQRSIPPLLYADMVAQCGVNFDAFGLQLYFGPGVDGRFVRDLFQVSSQLDQFLRMGKPLHITAVGVPSESSPGKEGAAEVKLDGGCWRQAWSEAVQAEWTLQFLQVALGKPFVDSVCWSYLVDNPRQAVPHSGLLRHDGSPKPAYEQWVRFRGELAGVRKT
jgi:GH35 family endo-1,4-beta-xylanase